MEKSVCGDKEAKTLAFLRSRTGTPTIALALVAVFLLAACEPFTARVEGGSESKPRWEVGVQF